MRLVYFNGKYIPEKEAKISIYDSALMFGDMVFEMTRSFNKKQFKLDEHLERLFDSIKFVRIPLKMSIDEMKEACLKTIEKNEPFFNDDDEHRLMINVSRGPLSLYKEVFDGVLEPTIVIADFPLKWTVSGMGELFDSGINAVIPSQRAIPSHLLEPKIKNRSRLHYLMANIEVSNWKGDNNWALLIDPDGFITEGTGDNFFIVKNGKIITPEPRNVLRGISREYIFQLAKEMKIECIEKNIDAFDVITADEAFMTGTPFCMLPVTKLNGINIGDGNRGNIFNQLLLKWNNNVGVNIEEQIKTWSSQIKQNKSESTTPYQFQNDVQ